MLWKWDFYDTLWHNVLKAFLNNFYDIFFAKKVENLLSPLFLWQNCGCGFCLGALLFFASLLFLVPFIFYFCHNFTTSIFLKCCWRRWLKWRPYFTLITDLADKRRFVFRLLFYDTLLFEQKPNMMRKDLIQFSLHSIFMRTLLNDAI